MLGGTLGFPFDRFELTPSSEKANLREQWDPAEMYCSATSITSGEAMTNESV